MPAPPCLQHSRGSICRHCRFYSTRAALYASTAAPATLACGISAAVRLQRCQSTLPCLQLSRGGVCHRGARAPVHASTPVPRRFTPLRRLRGGISRLCRACSARAAASGLRAPALVPMQAWWRRAEAWTRASRPPKARLRRRDRRRRASAAPPPPRGRRRPRVAPRTPTGPGRMRPAQAGCTPRINNKRPATLW